jgi:hypothetical protein
MDKEKQDEIEFRGKCHDCGAETSVVCSKDEENIFVSGGAFWLFFDR